MSGAVSTWVLTPVLMPVGKLTLKAGRARRKLPGKIGRQSQKSEDRPKTIREK
jgi:hypothetical protein